MPNSDELSGVVSLELPNLPQGWACSELDDLLQDNGLSYGIVQPGSEDPAGVPILRVKNIRRGRVLADDVLRVSKDIEAGYQRTRLDGGEVLLSLVGSVGEVAIAPPFTSGWNVARAIAVIRVKDPDTNSWVRLCLESGLAQQFMHIWQTTTVQATLNLRDVRRLPIVLPPKREREAITAIVGALDDKIAVNDRIVPSVEELCGAIFRASFPEALKFLKDSQLPDGWTAGVLGDVCSVLETGRRPKGGVSGYVDGIPSIGAESITQLGEFDFSKIRYVPEEFFAGMRQGILEDYDILLYKDGGRPGNFEPHVSIFGQGFPFERMCINEHVYRIRLASPLSQAYGYFWLSSEPVMAEMRSRGTGVAIPGLNSTAVKELPVAWPTIDRLAQFDKTALPLIDRALGAASESRALHQLRDILLPKLMSGQIRVRDAEKAAEDVA